MKKDVYMVYVTDNWHTYASRSLLIATDTKEKAVKYAMSYLHKNMCLSDYCSYRKQNLNNLNSYLQTQSSGLAETEIDIDCITLDEWQ